MAEGNPAAAHLQSALAIMRPRWLAGDSAVMDLASRDDDPQRTTSGIAKGMDFRSAAATRDADGLLGLPALGSCGGTVGLHHRTIDQVQFGARSTRNPRKDPLPDAASRPAIVPVVNGGVRAIFLRQIAPRYAGSQDEEHAAKHPAIVHAWPPGLVLRQPGLNRRPFSVSQIKSHSPSPLGSTERYGNR